MCTRAFMAGLRKNQQRKLASDASKAEYNQSWLTTTPEKTALRPKASRAS